VTAGTVDVCREMEERDNVVRERARASIYVWHYSYI